VRRRVAVVPYAFTVYNHGSGAVVPSVLGSLALMQLRRLAILQPTHALNPAPPICLPAIYHARLSFDVFNTAEGAGFQMKEVQSIAMGSTVGSRLALDPSRW